MLRAAACFAAPVAAASRCWDSRDIARRVFSDSFHLAVCQKAVAVSPLVSVCFMSVHQPMSRMAYSVVNSTLRDVFCERIVKTSGGFYFRHISVTSSLFARTCALRSHETADPGVLLRFTCFPTTGGGPDVGRPVRRRLRKVSLCAWTRRRRRRCCDVCARYGSGSALQRGTSWLGRLRLVPRVGRLRVGLGGCGGMRRWSPLGATSWPPMDACLRRLLRLPSPRQEIRNAPRDACS